MVDGWKIIQVRQSVWKRLGDLKKFPERESFNTVVTWLLDELDTRELIE